MADYIVISDDDDEDEEITLKPSAIEPEKKKKVRKKKTRFEIDKNDDREEFKASEEKTREQIHEVQRIYNRKGRSSKMEELVEKAERVGFYSVPSEAEFRKTQERLERSGIIPPKRSYLEKVQAYAERAAAPSHGKRDIVIESANAREILYRKFDFSPNVPGSLTDAYNRRWNAMHRAPLIEQYERSRKYHRMLKRRKERERLQIKRKMKEKENVAVPTLIAPKASTGKSSMESVLNMFAKNRSSFGRK